jgi:hypothetical protein
MADVAVARAANAIFANLSGGTALIVANLDAIGAAVSVGRTLLALVAAVSVAAADRATGTPGIVTVAETLGSCERAGHQPDPTAGRTDPREDPGNSTRTQCGGFAFGVGTCAIVRAVGAGRSACLSHAEASADPFRKGEGLECAERGGSKRQSRR